MKKEMFYGFIILLIVTLNFISAYNLEVLIEEGLDLDIEVVDEIAQQEKENDPIYQAIIESLTEEEIIELEQGIETIIEETDEEEIIEEGIDELKDYFIPKTMKFEDKKTRNIKNLKRIGL